MQQRRVRLGDILDDYCPRERRVTNHAVVAMVEDEGAALGAFLGGLVLAESEFSHQAHAEIRPLRDILAGLFFILMAVGVNWSLSIAAPWIS